MAVIVIDGCSTRCIRSKSPLWRRTMMVCLVVLSACATLTAATPHSSTGSGCNLADADALRDYNLVGVLPSQGIICGANSCCAHIEDKLRQQTRLDVEKFYQDGVAQVGSLFETRARRLEELFRDMMGKSKKELHTMFYRTYGMIYMQNANVFTDFFVELERYYTQGGIRLAETMDRFFTILYQRMFVVINAQYDFNDDYLSCVAKDIADLKPFGDIPNKLAGMLRRAFVATRTFHRSLGKGALVVEKMMKLNITEACGADVTLMQHCDVCTGRRGPGACNQYCSDTIRKCFGDLSELNEKWNIYIDGLDKVADKLLGPFNIEVVVEPINVKISEAIMNFQDTGTEVSQKVFQKCGQPKLKGDRTRRAATDQTSKELKRQSLHFNKNKKKHKKTNDYERQSMMEKRIVEVKNKIKDAKNFWENLRYSYCNNVTTAAPGDAICWNGFTLSGYTAPQAKLPKNQLIYEQTYTLGVLISHLESAFMGQDVDETDDEDDDEDILVQSGSGSGAEPDEDDTHIDEEDDEVLHTTLPGSTSTTSTTTTTTTESNDVELGTEFNGETRNNEDEPTVVQASSATELTKALAHYILPIVMVWFGGAVTELL